MSKTERSLQNLIATLQSAYSGELAAAYAYRGHWQSVSDADDRKAIQEIEDDEWRHRQLVGEMLTKLGSQPNKAREKRATLIGRALGFLCHVTGWLGPMYGAGKLESRNVVEYEMAARYARDCGRADLIECLLEMAEVEWEHEKYFRSQVLRHAIGRRLPIWPAPPLKEMIRISFQNDTMAPPIQPAPGEVAQPVASAG